jgi:MFS family permease
VTADPISPVPPAAGGDALPASRFAWAPLRRPFFRALWIATVASNVGAFMTDVGQRWLMATATTSPLLVALMTSAVSLPYFLFGLPAGALADVVDRRRLLIAMQAVMAVVSGTLCVWSLMGAIPPWGLLALAAASGVAAAFNDPAWYAIPAEILPDREIATGITLNGVGWNIGRTVGPALGGLAVAAAGPFAAFLFDALATTSVVLVLATWRRPASSSALPAERIVGAMRAGVRFARHSVPLRRVLLHAFAFMACASAATALMPLLAVRTGQGALALGLLLGAMGCGSLAGATLLPWLRERLSFDSLVSLATATFGVVVIGLGQSRSLVILVPLLLVGGVAWITALSSLNVAAQRASPRWVKARALAVYLIVFQAGVAGGSVVWGALAARTGLEVVYAAAGAGLLIGVLVLRGLRLSIGESAIDHTPTHHWPDPEVDGEPHPDDGPVMVQVEYRVAPERAAEFARAMEEVERSRRRHGAVEWWLLRDAADARTIVETWVAATWAEHLRQHERVSVADRDIEERARSFLVAGERPRVRHFIAGRETPEADGASLSIPRP